MRLFKENLKLSVILRSLEANSSLQFITKPKTKCIKHYYIVNMPNSQKIAKIP